MNLSQLRHLIAVADAGSFTRAAEAVHLTQPALSRSVQALEQELGLCLVDRVGKRSEVSAGGRSVVERARRIVFEAEELRRIAPHLTSGLAGTLGVGLGAGPGAVLSIPLLKHFAQHYPHVRLTVSRASTSLLLQSLRERTLDMAVLDARSVSPTPDLAIQTLPDMLAGFFCRAGHPLARRKKVDFEALLSYPIATAPLSDEVARLLVNNLGPRAHPQQMVTLSCDDIATLVQATLESDAIFLGIAAAVRPLLDRRKLLPLPVWPSTTKVGRFALITLAGRSEPPALPMLRRFVAEHMRD